MVTILRKRRGLRALLRRLRPGAVAAFGDDDVARCLADPGIVRNRAKVDSAIGNARAWLELDDPVAHLWAFVDGAPIQNHWTRLGELPATTAAVRRHEQGAQAGAASASSARRSATR